MFGASWAGRALPAVAALATIGCSAVPVAESATGSSQCMTATIQQLWDNPAPFDGRRLCMSGFFGRMVPYGEDSAKFYTTQQEAEETDTPRYVRLYLPLTLRAQERLSRYSAQPVQVEGIFEYEAPCWPQPGREPARCFPPRPMRLYEPQLTFPDGTRFR